MRSGSSAGRLVGTALGYVERGWPVLPLVPRAKRPLTKTGLLEASTDTAQVLDWWARWPFANIGLRTGVQFDALDVDGEVGRASLEAKAGPGTRHPGPVSRTGRGEHWLYLPSGTANRAGLLDKLDWRGTNGYIVAPPSVHPDGHTYEWAEKQGPETPLPTVPEWLAPLLTEWTEPKEYPPTLVNPYGPTIEDIARRKGYAIRRDGGGRFAMECPFHDGDNEPSMKLYPNNTFYCFGCGAWGDMLNLLQEKPRYKHGR